MASLKSIVERWGIPVKIRCTTEETSPFTIIKEFDEERYLVRYKDGSEYCVLKECKETNDYEKDE
jgi:hypothetical protein